MIRGLIIDWMIFSRLKIFLNNASDTSVEETLFCLIKFINFFNHKNET